MHIDTLIIGGGAAGLYAASLFRGAAILEESDEMLGLLNSITGLNADFLYDIGGHVYTTKDSTLNALFLNADKTIFNERRAYFDFQKRVPYPLQYNLSEYYGVEPHVSNEVDSKPSLAHFLEHNFGPEVFTRFLEPFNSRVWSTPPHKMACDWVQGRVALMKDKSASWGSNSSFMYVPAFEILKTLYASAINNGSKVLTGMHVTAIDAKNKRVYVNGTVFHGWITYNLLIDTSGFALKAINDFTLPINYVTTIGVGLNTILDDDFHWWYNGVNNESPIHRITLLSRYHPVLAPEGCDSLLIEIPKMIATKTAPAVASNEYVRNILESAHFPHTILDSDILDATVFTTKGYPIPILGHREIVAHSRMKGLQNDILMVGRWGAHGYYNLDHILADVQSAFDAYMHPNTEAEDAYYSAKFYYKGEEGA